MLEEYIYIFIPPAVLGKAVKYGITDNAVGRLGKYQLPYGPTYEASYAWLAKGEKKNIHWLEKSVQGHFRHSCWGVGPGMTEWLNDIDWIEVRDYILTVSKDIGIKLEVYGDGPWNPNAIICKEQNVFFLQHR
jgi:hypothetical protein